MTSLNLSLKKKSKHNKKKSQSCVKIVKLQIKKLLVLEIKVKTQQKNHKAVLKLCSSSSSDMDLIILVLRKKILIINISWLIQLHGTFQFGPFSLLSLQSYGFSFNKNVYLFTCLTITLVCFDQTWSFYICNLVIDESLIPFDLKKIPRAVPE